MLGFAAPPQSWSWLHRRVSFVSVGAATGRNVEEPSADSLSSAKGFTAGGAATAAIGAAQGGSRQSAVGNAPSPYEGARVLPPLQLRGGVSDAALRGGLAAAAAATTVADEAELLAVDLRGGENALCGSCISIKYKG